MYVCVCLCVVCLLFCLSIYICAIRTRRPAANNSMVLSTTLLQTSQQHIGVKTYDCTYTLIRHVHV